MYGHTFISTQPLQDLRFATLCGNPYRWSFVQHAYMLGAWGSFMYFEIENKDDMKSFGEYLKFQSRIFIPETIHL